MRHLLQQGANVLALLSLDDTAGPLILLVEPQDGFPEDGPDVALAGLGAKFAQGLACVADHGPRGLCEILRGKWRRRRPKFERRFPEKLLPGQLGQPGAIAFLFRFPLRFARGVLKGSFNLKGWPVIQPPPFALGTVVRAANRRECGSDLESRYRIGERPLAGRERLLPDEPYLLKDGSRLPPLPVHPEDREPPCVCKPRLG